MSSRLHEISPLIPEDRVSGHLHELAATLLKERLETGQYESIIQALRSQLRFMNSYYTNRIEGQHTRPRDMERAFYRDMDADEKTAKLQRLAIAHLETEEEIEAVYNRESAGELFGPVIVQDIHRKLYEKLPQEDLITDEGDAIVPGEFRKKDVNVGRHLAPSWEHLAEYLDNWSSAYKGLPTGEKSLIGIAAAHHRLAWIHPFRDGNGRVARLHSHLLLFLSGYTGGIWSVMRGFARNRDAYYKFLDMADSPRKGDLDGRGNLSQDELVHFIQFFLETCIDQARFMKEMLRIDRLKEGLLELLLHLQAHPWQIGSEKSLIKTEGLEALHYVAITGKLERGKFVAMTGLGERSGRRMLATLLDYGVLKSESQRAPVEFNIPMKSLRYLFPRLWPEAEADFD